MATQPSAPNRRVRGPGGGFGRVIAGSLLASVVVGPIGFCAAVYLGALYSLEAFVVSAVGPAIAGGAAGLVIGRRMRGGRVDGTVLAGAVVGVLASVAVYFGLPFLLLAMGLMPQ